MTRLIYINTDISIPNTDISNFEIGIAVFQIEISALNGLKPKLTLKMNRDIRILNRIEISVFQIEISLFMLKYRYFYQKN